MTNSRASGAIIKLANYEAASEEATFTHTQTLTNDKYACIIVYIDGELAVTGKILSTLNGAGSTSNSSVGHTANASAITTAATVGAASLTLLEGISNDRSFYIKWEISCSDIAASELTSISWGHIGKSNAFQQMAHRTVDTSGVIDSITITADQNWNVGTKISIFGVLR